MRQDESEPSYDSAFFQALEEGVARSADAGTDLIMELIAPKSAVDVGCGTGLWLAALRSRGVTDVVGVDGPWVPRDQLAIPEALFHQHDLTRPLALDRPFDLALCLETAEHLPPEAADPLVRALTELAPIVVFSAAIPEQRGEGHINLQWPQYWIDLFAGREYRCSTVLRERLWHAEEVDVWYRQNILCFAADSHVPLLGPLFATETRAGGGPVDIVHPGLFLHMSRNLGEYADYTKQLETQLHETREQLRRMERTLPYRLYMRLKPALIAVRTVSDRVRRK
jgi:SAM-dependent methyltransferase